MSKMHEWKMDYEKLTASNELKERMEKKMKRERTKNRMKKWSAVAVCAIAVVISGLNVSPSFANTLSDIPGVKSIVKVLTLNKYEVKDDGYQAEINVAQVQGLKDKKVEKEINEKLKAKADALIAEFEEGVEDCKEHFGDQTVHMGVTSDYVVKTDSEDYYAIMVYVENNVSTAFYNSFYSFNKDTGEYLTFPSLFKDGADYVTPISSYIKNEMIRLNNEEDKWFAINGMYDRTEGGFEQIAEDQKFYINEDGDIVVVFSKYDVAPGCEGSPEFVIPKDVVKDVVKAY